MPCGYGAELHPSVKVGLEPEGITISRSSRLPVWPRMRTRALSNEGDPRNQLTQLWGLIPICNFWSASTSPSALCVDHLLWKVYLQIMSIFGLVRLRTTLIPPVHFDSYAAQAQGCAPKKIPPTEDYGFPMIIQAFCLSDSFTDLGEQAGRFEEVIMGQPRYMHRMGRILCR
ncbi:hypothetical protein WG66_016889 [Moniliophthora roreri]|nr:hypothetical protein WG66_016889 [Moniliophthora roreri]